MGAGSVGVAAAASASACASASCAATAASCAACSSGVYSTMVVSPVWTFTTILCVMVYPYLKTEAKIKSASVGPTPFLSVHILNNDAVGVVVVSKFTTTGAIPVDVILEVKFTA